MIATIENISIEPIHEKDAWRICDFCTINSGRLKRYFPLTLQQNLTPDLSGFFAKTKVKEFEAKEEFLFTLKENENRTIVGLIYIKKIDWNTKQAELAYCIGYQYEGKGLMSKVVKALSKYAFEELQLKTLQIISHKSNLGSVKVALNCSYTWQKTLIAEHTPPGENPLDMELYELYA